MKRVIVGRHVNGISLNSLEYLLDDDGAPKEFGSEDEAKEFLREAGCTDDEIYYMVFEPVAGVQ